jgi:hypothetical protein
MGENLMSDENLVNELRRHAVKLERHRRRVTRAQRSLAIVSDAYSVVIEHLLRTASSDGGSATRDETSAASQVNAVTN